MVGLIALALTGAVFAATGYNLVKGGIFKDHIPVYAEFGRCGQSLPVGGDVKLRGVLVGEIQQITRVTGSDCVVELGMFPESLEQIPQDAGAQIRAKTIFGEKWVELLYPKDRSGDPLAEGDRIPSERTIDPLEVETILNTALPLLDAIDPDSLAGFLEALGDGFVGHEEAAIRAMERGIEAMAPFNDNRRLAREGIRQLREAGEVFNEIDDDLLSSMRNLDRLGRFTSTRADLIARSLDKAPLLLDELSLLFETRFVDFVRIVDKGATVIGVLAAHRDDLDRLLTALPKFNSSWIRNLAPLCRYRQVTDEPGKSAGDRVPGRCWRVHNLLSHSQGAYGPDEQTDVERPASDDQYRKAGLKEVTDVGKLLFAPLVYGSGPR